MTRIGTAAGSATGGSQTDQHFAAVVNALRRDPRVVTARMFGSDGLKVQGKVFAMLVKKRLIVKLPKERVETLLRGGLGVPFDPGHGRVMKEWIAIAPSKAEDWIALAEEAKAFVQPA